MYMATRESDNKCSTSEDDSWRQFYRQTISEQALAASSRTPAATLFRDQVSSDATAVTTTVPSSSAPSFTHGDPSAASGHLNPEGRVSKPVRRRSRASRRTPTTVLNTDTTNFRAMVQQFTGGPTPFTVGFHPAAPPNFDIGLGNRQQILNPTPAVMVPSGASYNHLQFQQQQQQSHQHEHQPYMFSLNSGTQGHGDHAFLQRLGNSRPNMEMNSNAAGEFSMGDVSSHVPRPRLPSSNENRDNLF